MKKLPRKVAHQHKRAGQAKEITCAQQHQHQRPAEMHPAKNGGEVLRREARSEKPVRDHRDADEQHRNREQSARVTPFEKSSQSGNPQQIEWKRVV